MLFQQLRQRMKWIIIAVCVAFAVTLLYVGGINFFGGGPQQVQAVARVNGDAINAAQVQQMYFQTVNLYRQFGQNVSQIQRQGMEFSALQQLVDYQLMVQAAKRDKVKIDQSELDDTIRMIKDQYGDRYADVLRSSGMTERDLRDALREQLLVEALREQRSAVDVTEDELRRAYDESLQEIEVRHILIEPEEGEGGQPDWNGALSRAEDLLQRLKAGEDFSAIAAEFSDDGGSSADGGNLGWIDRETPFVPEFLDAAFGLEVGHVSDPVKSDFGYHLIEVTGSRSKDEAPFDEVKESLKARMEAERGQAQFQQWLDEERSKAQIELLDPRYRAYQLMLNDRLDQAIAQYREAIATSPLDPYLYFHLATALEEVDADDEALEAYVQAAETSGMDPELWFALGEAYRERQALDAARDAYLKASEFAPSNLGLHQALSMIFAEMGLQELAAEQSAKADEIREILLQQEQARQEQLRLQQELQRQLEEAQSGADQEAADESASTDASESNGADAGAETAE